MKIKPKNNKPKLLIKAAALMSTIGLASAANIITAGSNIDLGPGWRTSTDAKNDIDGNNVLGTDGYRYVTDNAGGNGANDVESSAPSYAAFNLTTANFRGNASYALIDDPTTTPGGAPSTLRSGTFNPTAAPNNAEGAFISFGTIDFNRAAAAGETVRIGLMVDNLDNIIFNSHMLRLSHGGSDFDVSTTAETDTDNQISDWYYWDVSDFADGDSIEVWATSSEGNPPQTQFAATIGAFSFDSVVVPEPSSTALLGLGGLALLARRRK
ncbi:MAG: PEP-CTERM sorting domain-containing protein [Akkermansiaceae bacterium]